MSEALGNRLHGLLVSGMSWRSAAIWAAALVGCAILLRWSLSPLLGSGYPFVTFYPAVIFASALGGFRCGGLAFAGAVIAAWRLFIPDRGGLDAIARDDVLLVLVFAFNVSWGAVCAALLRSALVRVAASDQRHALMVRELNHRVKNNLATVLSVARQTGRRSGSFDAFLPAFEDRIIALSRSHELLLTSEWGEVEIRAIVATELAAYAPAERTGTALTGPSLVLTSSDALTLSMIIHELATNSAKYGALSADGRVVVEWTEADDGACRLTWSEAGGPAVARPPGEGFGSALISRLARALRGSVDMDFRPDGLVATLTFRPSRAAAPEPSSLRIPSTASPRALLPAAE